MTPFKVWREDTRNVSPNIIKLSRFFYKDLNEFEKHLAELAYSSDKWLQFLKTTHDELQTIPTKKQASDVERLFIAPDGEIISLNKIIWALEYVIGLVGKKNKPTGAGILAVGPTERGHRDDPYDAPYEDWDDDDDDDYN